MQILPLRPADAPRKNHNISNIKVALRSGPGTRRPRRAASIFGLILIKARSKPFGHSGPMQRAIHSLSCLMLALALVLSGPGGTAPAKGAMLVELCADGAPSLIWIDAEGTPVPPPGSHVKCLDCIIFSAPLPDRADGCLAPLPSRLALGLSLPAPPMARPIAHLRPIPRGPPPARGRVLRDGDLRPAMWSPHLLVQILLDEDQAKLTGPGAWSAGKSLKAPKP